MQSELFKTNKISTQEVVTSQDDTTELVCFRDLIPEIKETTYLTHSVYYYPAKFIPHVVRYCINSYTSPGDTVVDPFAGSGTVGLEAHITNRNSFLLDLNPLLNHIIPIKMPNTKNLLKKEILFESIDIVSRSKTDFVPDWSNCEYWYPPEFLDTLKQYWGGQKQLHNDLYAKIIEAVLVKMSKHFSYAEHKTPKLFKSKYKTKYVNELLEIDWKRDFDKMLYSTSSDIMDRVNQFVSLYASDNNKTMCLGGEDSAYFKYGDNIKFNAVITSPPYMQAQEYMRTAKLDLYWLGYKEEAIKRLSRLEIPYRKNPEIIETATLNSVRKELKRADLLKLLDSYFYFTIKTLENAGNNLCNDGKMLAFIGNPKVDGIKVEIWRILQEYFTERGYRFDAILEDRIKTRQLFGARKNKNPDGMKSEYLLVLSKK